MTLINHSFINLAFFIKRQIPCVTFISEESDDFFLFAFLSININYIGIVIIHVFVTFDDYEIFALDDIEVSGQ